MKLWKYFFLSKNQVNIRTIPSCIIITFQRICQIRGFLISINYWTRNSIKWIKGNKNAFNSPTMRYLNTEVAFDECVIKCSIKVSLSFFSYFPISPFVFLCERLYLILCITFHVELEALLPTSAYFGMLFFILLSASMICISPDVRG